MTCRVSHAKERISRYHFTGSGLGLPHFFRLLAALHHSDSEASRIAVYILSGGYDIGRVVTICLFSIRIWPGRVVRSMFLRTRFQGNVRDTPHQHVISTVAGA